jgi:hypothetical protein
MQAEENLTSEEGSSILKAPTANDALSFENTATTALSTIHVADVSKTDMPEACDISLNPCVAKILNCLSSRLVNTTDGKITPITTSCDCFVRGFKEPIEIPEKPDLQFTCPFVCVQSILRYASQYVTNANGPSGAALDCNSAISDVASDAFGNRHGYIAGPSETDSLQVLPVDNPLVVRAAEALRISINSQRRLNCPALHAYDEPGVIKYAKRGIVASGGGQYRLEVVFGNDVVFGRVVHLPKNRQLIDPTAQTALDDPSNLDGRFELLSSVPGPCDDGVPEQLAVSAEGESASFLSVNVDQDL